jgi:hypothetical protein
MEASLWLFGLPKGSGGVAGIWADEYVTVAYAFHHPVAIADRKTTTRPILPNKLLV